MTFPMTFSAEVAAARAAGTPIVALESTIITHGMPFPQNIQTARIVEQDVRDGGATPATIAVMNGALHIGLEADLLTDFAQSIDVAKVSRADMAFVIAQGRTGATTVAATMIAASAAGIEVFATGGIGGVHRGAELNFDVSADRRALARTPMAYSRGRWVPKQSWRWKKPTKLSRPLACLSSPLGKTCCLRFGRLYQTLPHHCAWILLHRSRRHRSPAPRWVCPAVNSSATQSQSTHKSPLTCWHQSSHKPYQKQTPNRSARNWSRHSCSGAYSN